jgi:predicted type IV restriction endonuclease
METNYVIPQEQQHQAFRLVKTLVDGSVEPDRISVSDAKTYMAVIVDNNSHRTICRLYLNNKQKYIGTISDRKVETRTMITGLDDIPAFANLLKEAARRYANM